MAPEFLHSAPQLDIDCSLAVASACSRFLKQTARKDNCLTAGKTMSTAIHVLVPSGAFQALQVDTQNRPSATCSRIPKLFESRSFGRNQKIGTALIDCDLSLILRPRPQTCKHYRRSWWHRRLLLDLPMSPRQGQQFEPCFSEISGETLRNILEVVSGVNQSPSQRNHERTSGCVERWARRPPTWMAPLAMSF